MTALAIGDAIPPDLVLPPGFDRIGETRKVANLAAPVTPALELELASLRPGTAARVRRLLEHRGTVAEFAEAEGIFHSHVYGLINRISRRGGPLAAALDRVRVRGKYLTDEDLTPCTRCGLRGHVAGDPDRCLSPKSIRWQPPATGDC